VPRGRGARRSASSPTGALTASNWSMRWIRRVCPRALTAVAPIAISPPHSDAAAMTGEVAPFAVELWRRSGCDGQTLRSVSVSVVVV
jgi:hypothetical protein